MVDVVKEGPVDQPRALLPMQLSLPLWMMRENEHGYFLGGQSYAPRLCWPTAMVKGALQVEKKYVFGIR